MKLPLPPNGYSYQAAGVANGVGGYSSGYGYPSQAMAAASFPAAAAVPSTAAGTSNYGSVPVAAFATLTADGSRDQVAGVPDTSM